MNRIKTAMIAATIAALAAAPVAAQSVSRPEARPAPQMTVDVITQGMPRSENHAFLPPFMLVFLTMWALGGRGAPTGS